MQGTDWNLYLTNLPTSSVQIVAPQIQNGRKYQLISDTRHSYLLIPTVSATSDAVFVRIVLFRGGNTLYICQFSCYNLRIPISVEMLNARSWSYSGHANIFSLPLTGVGICRALPFGAFICIKCSGTHRSLGVHISKVSNGVYVVLLVVSYSRLQFYFSWTCSTFCAP